MKRLLVYTGRSFDATNPYPLVSALGKFYDSIFVFDWHDRMGFVPTSSILKKIIRRLLRSWNAYVLNREFLRLVESKDFDLVIIVMGRYLSEETIKKISQRGTLVVCLSSDDPENKSVSSPNVLKSIPCYDLIISPRVHRFERYKELGAKRISKVNWYPHPSLLSLKPCLHAADEISLAGKVCFVGSWSNEREKILNCGLDNTIDVFGWGWNSLSNDVKSVRNRFGPISVETMGNVFYTYKISLNLLTSKNFDKTNLRLFEIPSMKGFQIMERNEWIVEFFEEDKEIVLFSSHEEMVDKINYYLKNEAKRCEIAINGYNRLISSNYNIESHAKDICKEINKLIN